MNLHQEDGTPEPGASSATVAGAPPVERRPSSDAVYVDELEGKVKQLTSESQAASLKLGAQRAEIDDLKRRLQSSNDRASNLHQDKVGAERKAEILRKITSVFVAWTSNQFSLPLVRRQVMDYAKLIGLDPASLKRELDQALADGAPKALLLEEGLAAEAERKQRHEPGAGGIGGMLAAMLGRGHGHGGGGPFGGPGLGFDPDDDR